MKIAQWYRLIFVFCVLFFSVTAIFSAPMQGMRSINPAEALVDVFWDPDISTLEFWDVDACQSCGVNIKQIWATVQVHWENKNEDGPIVTMTRSYDDFDIKQYDTVIIPVTADKGVRMAVKVVTDAGEFQQQHITKGQKEQYDTKIGNSEVLKSISIKFEPQALGASMLSLLWVGVADSSLLGRVIRVENELAGIDLVEQGYLKPESYTPEFKPTLGMVMDENQLEKMRKIHTDYKESGIESWLEKDIQKVKSQPAPEESISKYVSFWSQLIFRRPRDKDKLLTKYWGISSYGPSACLGGIIYKDKELLRLGARYALSLALSENWDSSFLSDFKGSAWEQRCFVHSCASHDIAVALDLAGELFTPQAKKLLLRRLSEEGMGKINFNFWKFDYIYTCNQAAWFSYGRLPAYCVLEDSWPRVKPYTNLARDELLSSLSIALEDDGGYVEGPTYFFTTVNGGLTGLYYMSQYRDKSLFDMLPSKYRKTRDFIAAVISTDDNRDVVPIGDCYSTMDRNGLAMMSSILPDSLWPKVFWKSIQRGGKGSGGFFSDVFRHKIPQKSTVEYPNLVYLPITRFMASHRMIGDETLKIFMRGNRPHAGHSHEDIGSFVIEFAGDTFAVDPGIISYSHPLMWLYKQAQRHNMLVPVGTSQRSQPRNPVAQAVDLNVEGDEREFHLKADMTAGWEEYYKYWRREINSENPRYLTIIDNYSLKKGSGVEFLWQTLLPVELSGNTAVITGKKSKMILTSNNGPIKLRELKMKDDMIQKCLYISNKAKEGMIKVNVEFELMGNSKNSF